jgi:hypothetical protein
MQHADVVSVCDKPTGAVIVSVKLRANLDVVVILTVKDVQCVTLDYRRAYIVPTYGAGVDCDPRAGGSIIQNLCGPIKHERRRIYSLRQGDRQSYCQEGASEKTHDRT